MIATTYGNYNNGYGFPASSQAMQAYTNYARQAYGITPPDQFAMSNGAFYQQMLQSQNAARQGLLQRSGLANPPADWQTMPLDQFLNWARSARQSMGPSQAPGRNQGQPQGQSSSPLQVHAHAYQNSNGDSVPVRSVRVNQTGNYNSQQRSDNAGQFNQFDANYGSAQLGKTYTVTVEWEDGRQQTTQVVNHGWGVDIW